MPPVRGDVDRKETDEETRGPKQGARSASAAGSKNKKRPRADALPDPEQPAKAVERFG